MKVDVRTIEHGSPEYSQEVSLRSNVLAEPLGLQFSPEDLAQESNDFHLGAFLDGKLIGCLILVRKNAEVLKMRQVAVAFEAQRLGVGKQMVAYAEAFAVQQGFSEIIMDARESALPFYQNLGYRPYGELFEQVTIPHIKMKKTLKARDAVHG